VTSPFTQARVMGGGSSLMGMVALRGSPDDYSSWGIPGWSWSDVLSYFRTLEDDRDFSGELHGASGPITIRRHHVRDWPPFCAAVGRATARLGWPMIGDLNGEFGDGYGALPLSSTLSGRVSAASGYLDMSTRSRPNLAIACATVAERLEFSGTQCVGALAVNEDGLQRYRAGHTIVCAGALHSPALLMRSGIGPADQLSTLGIPVVSALSGVGSQSSEPPRGLFGRPTWYHELDNRPICDPGSTRRSGSVLAAVPLGRGISRCWCSTSHHGTDLGVRSPGSASVS
jgi:5-(hydroxymethyl)furfural/furfural oxidase